MTTKSTVSPTAPHRSAPAEAPGAAPAHDLPPAHDRAHDPAPRSRWPWPLQVLLAVVVLAVATLAPATLALIPAMRRIDDPGTPITVVAAVMVSLCLCVMLAAIGGVALLVRLDGGRRLRDVGWRLHRRSLPLLGLGTALSAVVVLATAGPLTGAGLLRTEDAGIAGDPVWAVLVIGLSQAFLLQAIPEELIFRGYLLRSLRMNPLLAVVVSAVAFASLHLFSQGGQEGSVEHLAYLVDPLGFGLAAGALSLLTRSLWVAVGIHGGLHATLLASTLLEQTSPSFALGDGPALWLLGGLAWALVAAVAMVAVTRRGAALTTLQNTVAS